MFSPAPPDFATIGPLPVVALGLLAHIEAERRRTWEVSSTDLLVHPDGTLSARGHAPVRFERAGLTALLQHYTASFPRAPTLLSRLYEREPQVWADVWDTLFDPGAEGMPLDVKVHERGAPGARAVWSASPTSYPGSYHVGRLVADVSARWDMGPPPTTVAQYSAGESNLTLRLALGSGTLVVRTTDQYDAGGTVVTLEDNNGRDLGDPCPGLKTRRRATASGDAVSTVAESILTRARAAVVQPRGAR